MQPKRPSKIHFTFSDKTCQLKLIKLRAGPTTEKHCNITIHVLLYCNTNIHGNFLCICKSKIYKVPILIFSSYASPIHMYHVNAN